MRRALLLLDERNPERSYDELLKDLYALSAKYRIAGALLDPIIAAATTEVMGAQPVSLADLLQAGADAARRDS